jgi:RNA polymerase-interacting CarD/CdnL/TRCF family regulator
MRAETVPSAVAVSRPPRDPVPDDLPYYVPGVGAWPGDEIAVTPQDGRSAATRMWRYTAQTVVGPVVSMRPIGVLVRLAPGCLVGVLDALTAEPDRWPSAASDRQRLTRHLGEQFRNGGPEEVAQVWRSLASHGKCKRLTLMERELRDKARAICRSVLHCLPDSPDKSRALEILDDRAQGPQGEKSLLR